MKLNEMFQKKKSPFQISKGNEIKEKTQKVGTLGHGRLDDCG